MGPLVKNICVDKFKVIIPLFAGSLFSLPPDWWSRGRSSSLSWRTFSLLVELWSTCIGMSTSHGLRRSLKELVRKALSRRSGGSEFKSLSCRFRDNVSTRTGSSRILLLSEYVLDLPRGTILGIRDESVRSRSKSTYTGTFCPCDPASSVSAE